MGKLAGNCHSGRLVLGPDYQHTRHMQLLEIHGVNLLVAVLS